MVRRMASKIMPAIWNTKPIMTNLISPIDAMTTPTTIVETFRNTFRLGCDTPIPQLQRSTATGVVALSIWMKATLRYR
jgi:hypothetical protein